MKKLLLLAGMVLSGALFASWSPVEVSLVTPVQAPDRDYDIYGLRLNLIYGESKDVYGVDLGIVNRTKGDFRGVELGGVNIADDTMYGVQLGLVNWNWNDSATWSDRSIGFQWGFINKSDTFCGFQDGLLNISMNSFTGWEYGFVNYAHDVTGLQSGVLLIFGVNFATGAVNGCQIGLLNYAANMESGVQIGILNFISRGGFFPVFPIVNGTF